MIPAFGGRGGKRMKMETKTDPSKSKAVDLAVSQI